MRFERPHGWRYRQLGDVLRLKRGYDLPEPRRVPGPFPVVSSSGITGFHNEGRVCAPGVITGRYGTIGQVFYLDRDFWPLNTALYVEDFRENDPRYCAALLKTLTYSAYAGKSAVPGINRNDLHAIEVAIPALAEQRRIVATLSALDDKIDSNRRLAALLEETAATLFRARFVDFVGVEEFEESEIGPIPRGWRTGKLADLCDVRYGYTASADETPIGPRFLRVKDINKQPWIDWAAVPYCAIEKANLSRYRLLPGDVVVARMADPGKVAIIIDQVDAVCASYLVRLRSSSPAWAYFLHRFMRSSQYDAYVSSVMSGTVQKNINARVLTSAILAIPPDADVSAFADAVGPMYLRQARAISEVGALAVIRDALLPKLISGQIRVPDTSDPEEVIGPVAEEIASAAS